MRFIVKRADVFVSCYLMRGSRASGKNQLAIMLPILWKWCCALIRLQISTSEEICCLEDYPISIDRKILRICMRSPSDSLSFLLVCRKMFFFHLITQWSRNDSRDEREKWNEVKKLFSRLSETFKASIKQVSTQLKLKKTVRKYFVEKVFRYREK